MNTIPEKSEPVRINEKEDMHRHYLLEHGNDEIICSTGQQIINDSKLRLSLDDWKHEVEAMCAYIQKWIEAKDRPSLQAWSLVARGAQLAVFFCLSRSSFDFDLAEELAELNSHITRTFRVGPVEILQIPADERERFIDHSREMFNAHAGTAH